MSTQAQDWKKYVVTVGGIDFRPVSMGTLTMLYAIQSPLVIGGEVSPVDFAVFAWMHAAPLMEVVGCVKARSHEKKAIIWGSEAPPIVFASYIPDTIKALAVDLGRVFIDKDSGFIPFPVPSPLKQSWWQRAWTTMRHLFRLG